MAWAVRNLTLLESHMMSVMRVCEMTDLHENDSTNNSTLPKLLMPRELSGAGDALKIRFVDSSLDFPSSPLTEKALIGAGWPWKGGVRFQNVSMRYNSASPLVLNKLKLDIPPGSTLGSLPLDDLLQCCTSLIILQELLAAQVLGRAAYC